MTFVNSSVHFISFDVRGGRPRVKTGACVLLMNTRLPASSTRECRPNNGHTAPRLRPPQRDPPSTTEKGLLSGSRRWAARRIRMGC